MAFGSGKKQRIEELEAGNAALTQQVADLTAQIQAVDAEKATLQKWIEYLKGVEPVQLAAQVESYRAQVAAEQQKVTDAQRRLATVLEEVKQARAKIVETDEIALLQEIGIYQYRHPLDDAVAYKSQLATIKDKLKTMARDGNAVDATMALQFNNSAAQGAKVVKDLSKLMLRAYNSEADNIVRTLRPHTLDSAISRLTKARETIAKLGKMMDIRISQAYHTTRIKEIELTADYLVKVEEEKERLREERARQREEEKALREFQAEKTRLEKERSHYQTAYEKVLAKGDEAAAEQMAAKLEEIGAAIKGVEDREANIRAGYVYVISNFGSFGEHVVKIGMTRRLEPMDRVRELGDASVPFNFDVHALIFSEDAVGLESRLHKEFAERRVNLVNMRREYFYTTPADVRTALERVEGQHLLEFHEVPEAAAWRASGGAERITQLLAQDLVPADVDLTAAESPLVPVGS